MLLKDLIANPAAYAEQRVTVNGWVRANRKQKSFGFIALNDGTALANVQLVYDDSLANFDAAGHLTVGSALSAKGTVVLTEGGKQPFEIRVETLEILNQAPSDYPLQKSVTASNICAHRRICVRARTLFLLCSGCAR